MSKNNPINIFISVVIIVLIITVGIQFYLSWEFAKAVKTVGEDFLKMQSDWQSDSINPIDSFKHGLIKAFDTVLIETNN